MTGIHIIAQSEQGNNYHYCAQRRKVSLGGRSQIPPMKSEPSGSHDLRFATINKASDVIAILQAEGQF